MFAEKNAKQMAVLHSIRTKNTSCRKVLIEKVNVANFVEWLRGM